MAGAHDVDFRILGSEMQFVEVELDPGESAIAEAGSMMYMTAGIEMETIFGDGSQQRSGGCSAVKGLSCSGSKATASASCTAKANRFSADWAM